MKIKIGKYNERFMAHECRVEGDLRDRLMDVLVDGGFPDGTNPEDVIGKEIEADYSYPHVEIAMGVKSL